MCMRVNIKVAAESSEYRSIGTCSKVAHRPKLDCGLRQEAEELAATCQRSHGISSGALERSALWG